MQGESKFGDVKHMIRDSTFLSLDAHPAIDADDVVVNNSSLISHSFCFNHNSLQDQSGSIFESRWSLQPFCSS